MENKSNGCISPSTRSLPVFIIYWDNEKSKYLTFLKFLGGCLKLSPSIKCNYHTCRHPAEEKDQCPYSLVAKLSLLSWPLLRPPPHLPLSLAVSHSCCLSLMLSFAARVWSYAVNRKLVGTMLSWGEKLEGGEGEVANDMPLVTDLVSDLKWKWNEYGM